MTIDRVLLDMDGVLCDFASGAFRVHGKRFNEDDWPLGSEDFASVLGVSNSHFWDVIDAFDEEEGFWSRLKPYPWFEDLIEMARPYEFTIATSPSRHEWCPSGKVAWLRRHVGDRFMGFVIGQDKHLLAKSGRVLIDDRDGVCEQFRAHGGEAILFPQPWNANHPLIADRLKYVWNELERLNAT